VVAGEDGAQILPATRDASASDEALERTGGGTGGGAGAHHIFLIGIGCTWSTTSGGRACLLAA
jgi:hypothetical protein